MKTHCAGSRDGWCKEKLRDFEKFKEKVTINKKANGKRRTDE
jgi:hypothetical protein